MSGSADDIPSRGLRYTHQALADLAAISRWLRQPGAGTAPHRKLVSIRGAIRRLRLYPCLFPVDQHPGVRELPCGGGYRVLYRVNPDTGFSETVGDVVVLRVFGPGHDRGAL